NFARVADPFAEEEEFAQAERFAERGAGLSAHHDRLDLGEVALLIVREAEIELLAGDEAENAVAEEFEAFIGGGAGIGAGRMREGGAEQLRPLELITNGFLTRVEDRSFAGERQFRGRHVRAFADCRRASKDDEGSVRESLTLAKGIVNAFDRDVPGLPIKHFPLFGPDGSVLLSGCLTLFLKEYVPSGIVARPRFGRNRLPQSCRPGPRP